MIVASDFRLLSVQAVVYTPQCDDFRQASILGAVISKHFKRYDGAVETSQPQKLDFGKLPVQLSVDPRFVTVSSEDKRWRFQSSPKRTDSFWSARGKEENNKRICDITDECLAPLLDYPVDAGLQIGRLALVVRRWAPCETPAKALVNSFAQKKLVDPDKANSPLRNSQQFQLHNLKKYESPFGYEVNSWVRCRSDLLVNDQDGIAVENDMNTLGEEPSERAFRREEIEQFFSWAAEEMDQILELYYPDEVRDENG